MPRLIPGFFRSPRWVPVVGWLMVVDALVAVVFGTLGIALGGYLYDAHHIKLNLEARSMASIILLISALLTLAISLPAMIARRRTRRLWPLRWLRNAALIFTFLNALVDFATEGFGALLNMSIGLFTSRCCPISSTSRRARKSQRCAARTQRRPPLMAVVEGESPVSERARHASEVETSGSTVAGSSTRRNATRSRTGVA